METLTFMDIIGDSLFSASGMYSSCNTDPSLRSVSRIVDFHDLAIHTDRHRVGDDLGKPLMSGIRGALTGYLTHSHHLAPEEALSRNS